MAGRCQLFSSRVGMDGPQDWVSPGTHERTLLDLPNPFGSLNELSVGPFPKFPTPSFQKEDGVDEISVWLAQDQ